MLRQGREGQAARAGSPAIRLSEHIVLGFVHQRGELGQSGAQLTGDFAPLLAGRCGVVLCEGDGDEGGDDAPSALAGMGERVAKTTGGEIRMPSYASGSIALIWKGGARDPKSLSAVYRRSRLRRSAGEGATSAQASPPTRLNPS
jgi:hypothetical protein